MKAGIPVQGLHLDGDDEGALGMTTNRLADHDDVIAVRVPLDGSTPFCIFGSRAQLARFAGELAHVLEALDQDEAVEIEAEITRFAALVDGPDDEADQ